MKFPFVSFFIAIIIWIFCLVVFAYFTFYESSTVPATLEIDASIVDKVSRPLMDKKNLQKNFIDQKESQKIVEKNDVKNFSSEKNPTKLSGAQANAVATITSRPLPEMPEDLRQEAFNSYAIARFYIAVDGSTTVELIQPCSNPRLNHLLLQSLRQWKFVPARVAGVSIASTQDIKVNFKVE